MLSSCRRSNTSETSKAVYTTKYELLAFLHLLDSNPIIQQFLQCDSSFRLADKYLIAMVFIYFKRAQLSPDDYTYLNFFAGLCLAHSMEEDIELSYEIYPWALGTDGVKDQLSKLLQLKVLLWQAMDYRAAVSRHCCKQLISISQKHPVWQRERSSSYFKEIQKIHGTFQNTPTVKELVKQYGNNQKKVRPRK